MDLATDALPARSRAPWPRLAAWLAPLLLALGPAVIGLCADNDAGGMLSYLVTGASHGLAWLLPALIFLGAPTCFVMWVSLRVAEATRQPYSTVLAAAVGRPVARIEALALYALNALILVTEFVGMTLGLSLLGLPRALSAALTFALVVALTGSRTYPRIEQLLLRVAAGNLAFLPALLLARRAPGAAAAAFSVHPAHAPFLLLALAGNTLAPWMIYWQQNAVWAGDPRTPRQRRTDLLAGQAAMIAMASAVLLLGALVPGTAAAWASPVAWIFHDGGPAAGTLFAIGLFDAGLLAACTISLSSLWTLRAALGHGPAHPSEAPNRGPWQVVHLVTLGAAAAVVLWPGLAAGALALWAQALGALWLPVSLVLLGTVAGSRRVRAVPVLGLPVRAALWAMAGGYVVLAYLGLGGRA
jgi:Mn2+/Fe2+ NRAMP family transporter